MPPPEPIQVSIENKDEALAPFYAALASKTSVVRILHFGDSHVASDIWTKYLRLGFQSRFGDAGAGSVLPGSVFRGYRRVGVSLHACMLLLKTGVDSRCASRPRTDCSA
jgi:hypothetical protein